MPLDGVLDDADENRAARLQHAELLELLGLLQRRGRQRGEFQQHVAAIGVNAQVLVEERRVVERPRIVRFSTGRSRTKGIGLRLK